MKRLFHLILLPLLFISCGDDDKPTLPYISLDQNEIELKDSGSKAKIKLETDGEWRAIRIPDWIALDQTEGNTSTEITITALNNKNVEPRETEIYFLRDDDPKKDKDYKKAMLKIYQSKNKNNISWSSLRFSLFDDINVSFIPGKNEVERIYSFSTRSLFINPDANTDIKDKIFIGNLINRNLEKNMDISVYKGYTFNPITISTDIGNEKSLTYLPSKSKQDAYANLILSKKPKGSESFYLDGTGVYYNSHRELNLIGLGNMGIKLDEMIYKKSYREQEMMKENGLIYSFNHTLFTLVMDLEPHIVKEEIKKEDFPNKSISFISDVSYGRIGLLIIESDNDVKKIREIINKIFQNNENITQEDSAILEELDAYHLYFDKSQKLVIAKGKVDIIKAYQDQITGDIYNVYPFKCEICDYFSLASSIINYTITLP